MGVGLTVGVGGGEEFFLRVAWILTYPLPTPGLPADGVSSQVILAGDCPPLVSSI
jgi:hypothetical protein